MLLGLCGVAKAVGVKLTWQHVVDGDVAVGYRVRYASEEFHQSSASTEDRSGLGICM